MIQKNCYSPARQAAALMHNGQGSRVRKPPHPKIHRSLWYLLTPSFPHNNIFFKLILMFSMRERDAIFYQINFKTEYIQCDWLGQEHTTDILLLSLSCISICKGLRHEQQKKKLFFLVHFINFIFIIPSVIHIVKLKCYAETIVFGKIKTPARYTKGKRGFVHVGNSRILKW